MVRPSNSRFGSLVSFSPNRWSIVDETCRASSRSEEVTVCGSSAAPLTWLRVGAGPPLVLVGGLYGHCEFQRPIAAALGRDFQVWCPSLPGEEAPDQAPETVEETAGRLLEWSWSVGLQQFFLCGISLGGAIALAMTLQAPERVLRLASVVSFAEYSFLHPQLRRLFDFLLESDRETACRRLSRSMLLGLTVRELLLERAPVAAMGEYWEKFQLYRSAGELVWRRLKMMRKVSLLDRLPELKLPVLLVAAGRDRLVHPRHTRQAAARIAHAKLQMLPRSGHLFPFLLPEKLAATVMPFFLNYEL